ncbi:hypothetical protein ACLOAV_008584 [Pseudogymnoascus australis]
MTRLSTSLMLFGLLSATLTVAKEPFNQEEEMHDAACMCNQKENREGYLCCMAKNCEPKVFPASLLRQSLGCETRKLEFTFDVEEACGFSLTTTYAPPIPTSTSEAASDCDNDCFYSSFPGGSCTDDDACMCTQKKYRERYFCCMVKNKNCPNTVFPDALKRSTEACEGRNIPFTFDVEQVCGVKLTTTSPVATPTPTPSNDSTKSSAPESTDATTPDSTTEGSTPDSTTEGSTPDSTADAASSSTSEASSTGSVTPVPNGAPQATVVFNGVAILLAASAMLFL